VSPLRLGGKQPADAGQASRNRKDVRDRLRLAEPAVARELEALLASPHAEGLLLPRPRRRAAGRASRGSR
jgi:hypothetical protein